MTTCRRPASRCRPCPRLARRSRRARNTAAFAPTPENCVTLRKWILLAAILVLAALAGLSVNFRPDRAIRLATGGVRQIVRLEKFFFWHHLQSGFGETLGFPGVLPFRLLLYFSLDR